MPSVGWLVLAAVSASAVMQSDLTSYVLRTLTALAAAGTPLVARPRRRRDRLRPPPVRRRRAGRAVSGAASSVLTAATSKIAPTGSWLQWLEIGYVPFVAVGLLTIPGRSGGRARAIANGAIAATSLWYLALAVVIEPRGVADHLTGVARISTFGFIIVPIFVLAVLVSVLPRAHPDLRAFMLRAAAGLGTVVAADVCFFVATVTSGYSPHSWIGGLYEVGLVLVLAAGLLRTPASAVRPEACQRPWVPNLTGEVVLPFTPVALAVAVGAKDYLVGDTYTHAQMVPIMLIGISILARHVISVRDNGALMRDLAARERAALAESRRDPLTGLVNRTALVEHIGTALADPAQHPVAVAVLDLNDFKDVNDTHGHGTGDWLLTECGRALTGALPTAVVARLGGDEFAVCQTNAPDGGRALARAVTSAFASPLTLDRRQFTVRPSIGIVLDERSPGRAERGDAHHLLAHADVAMYQAKASKDTVQVPYVILGGAERSRAASLIRLRDEISHPDLSQFHVLYQPVVELSSGRIHGVEALLRWNHPELGSVPPDHFIPLSEQVGSVSRLGEHVLLTALRDLTVWHRVAPDVRLDDRRQPLTTSAHR